MYRCGTCKTVTTPLFLPRHGLHSRRAVVYEQQKRHIHPDIPKDDPRWKSEIFSYSNGGFRTIVINRPKKLHALSLSMIDNLTDTINAIDSQEELTGMMLTSVGNIAFCAGGDIAALYHAGMERRQLERSGRQVPSNHLTKEFFRKEYQLAWRIATLRKGFAAAMDGITMGAGAGLALNSMSKMATERTILAMPETHIGFFPDVGTSYTLARLPANVGVMLGLSGFRLMGADVFHAGIASQYTDSYEVSAIGTAFTNSLTPHRHLASTAFDSFHVHENLPESTLAPHLNFIERTFLLSNTVEHMFEKLEAESQSHNSPHRSFAKDILSLMRRASPVSLKVTLELLRRASLLPLEECLGMDYRVSQRFISGEDFFIGVDAAIISRSGSPVWSKALHNIGDADVQAYFKPLSRAEELPLHWPQTKFVWDYSESEQANPLAMPARKALSFDDVFTEIHQRGPSRTDLADDALPERLRISAFGDNPAGEPYRHHAAEVDADVAYFDSRYVETSSVDHSADVDDLDDADYKAVPLEVETSEEIEQWREHENRVEMLRELKSKPQDLLRQEAVNFVNPVTGKASLMDWYDRNYPSVMKDGLENDQQFETDDEDADYMQNQIVYENPIFYEDNVDASDAMDGISVHNAESEHPEILLTSEGDCDVTIYEDYVDDSDAIDGISVHNAESEHPEVLVTSEGDCDVTSEKSAKDQDHKLHPGSAYFFNGKDAAQEVVESKFTLPKKESSYHAELAEMRAALDAFPYGDGEAEAISTIKGYATKEQMWSPLKDDLPEPHIIEAEVKRQYLALLSQHVRDRQPYRRVDLMEQAQTLAYDILIEKQCKDTSRSRDNSTSRTDPNIETRS